MYTYTLTHKHIHTFTYTLTNTRALIYTHSHTHTHPPSHMARRNLSLTTTVRGKVETTRGDRKSELEGRKRTV